MIIKKRVQVYLALFLGFVLGVQDGFIALWRDGSPEPVKVFPYMAIMLPAPDRRSLEDGIRIESDEELAQFLEDFLS